MFACCSRRCWPATPPRSWCSSTSACYWRCGAEASTVARSKLCCHNTGLPCHLCSHACMHAHCAVCCWSACRSGQLWGQTQSHPAHCCCTCCVWSTSRPLPHTIAQEAGHPSISIICEKLTYVGTTRFEDDSRLPLGLSVNSASYGAKTLTQARLALYVGAVGHATLYTGCGCSFDGRTGGTTGTLQAGHTCCASEPGPAWLQSNPAANSNLPHLLHRLRSTRASCRHTCKWGLRAT